MPLRGGLCLRGSREAAEGVVVVGASVVVVGGSDVVVDFDIGLYQGSGGGARDEHYREIVLLRAYAKYMRQIGFALSQSFIESTLATHAPVARALVELFKTRFDPAPDPTREVRAAAQVQAIEAALESVDNLSEDRVLRQLLNRLEEVDTGRIHREELHVAIPEQRISQARRAAEVLGDDVFDKFPFLDGMRPMGRAAPGSCTAFLPDFS